MLLCKEREPEQLPDDLIELRRCREKELERIHHLERSNAEILEALEAEDDQELREAVRENEQVIAQKHEKIREIDAWVRQITEARASLFPSARAAAAPAPLPEGLDL
mmetsp:Transcript_74462/g.208057  ORF Transcript_74462/g.208057 Transcript_74462/m.208057 type:complete len:107 (+) Transcript_74462:162-482(+)